ncbi:MAG: universal stress protein [Puniceicoccaceae bacterium]
MNRYKKVIVPLSLQTGDQEVIAWAGKVSHMAGTDEVEFFHMVEVPEIPERAKEKYPWLTKPLDGMVKEQMEQLVRDNWEGREETTIGYTVRGGGNAVMSILERILEQGSDLVIVGRESYDGDTAVRLARKAPCSVMSIPAGGAMKLERIGVPTDFSGYSEHALDVALAFAEAEGLKEVTSLHIYNLGRFSHRIALPEEELKDMAEEYAEEQQKVFVSNVDLRGLEVQQQNSFHQVISSGILRVSREENWDLLVTGCRGRDTMTSWLLGGNAESLLRDAPIPVVAAKPKGTGQKLLEALLKD